METPKNGYMGNIKKVWKSEHIRYLIFLALVAIAASMSNNILASVFGTEYPLHTPISSSMEPTLNIGDLLIVQGVFNFNDVKANPTNGDIIIFRDPTDPIGIPIVHRAIEKVYDSKEEKYYFKTKGDNNPVPDQPYLFPNLIPEDYVLGKVLWRIPLLGYLYLFSETPAGRIVTIAVFIVLLALFFTEKKEEPGSPQSV